MSLHKSSYQTKPIQVVDDEPFTDGNKLALIIAIVIPIIAIMAAI